MDRFDWTLEGKKEMFIPYSNYELKWGCDMETKLMDKHINPACERWELHRVWVVSAERKEGIRHAQKSRRYYIDEDTFGAALYDAWDNSGEMFRSGAQYNIQAYGIPNNPLQDTLLNTWLRPSAIIIVDTEHCLTLGFMTYHCSA